MVAAAKLLIDIAADTAQLKKDLGDARNDLSAFGEGIAGVATKLIGFVAGLQAVEKVKAFAEEVNRAGIAAQEAANRYKLTAEQVQALQVISQRTGQSLDDLAKAGKQNVEWLQLVTDEAKRAGLVIDSEYTAALKRMADESEEANKRLLVLFAPAVTGVKSWIADALERIAGDLKAVAAQEGILDKILALGRMLSYGGGVGSAQDFQLSTRVKEVENAETALALQRFSAQQQGSLGPKDDGIAAAQKRVDDARVALAQYRDEQRRAAYGSGLQTLPPTVVEAGKATGGAGAVDDRFARTLQSLKDQAEAVQGGIQTLGAASGLATKEAERLAQLQIDIGLRTAQAIKSARTTDPGEMSQLADAARQLEELKARYAELKAVQATADEVSKKFGDGQKELADRTFYLNKALDAGKIGIDEYNGAMKEATQTAQRQKLAHEGLKEGLEGVSAGCQFAALSMSQSQTDFKAGQDLFNAGFQTISQAITEFADKGTIDFGRLSKAFAAMLIEMAVRWAAMSFLKGLGGIFNGFTGNPAAGTGVAAGSTPVFEPSIIAFPGRASGGPVSAGMPYWVGESGPERFIPDTAGTIVPSGGGGNVVINNYAQAKVTANRRQSGGGMNWEVLIEPLEAMMAGRMSQGKGALAPAIEGNYGLARQGRR